MSTYMKLTTHLAAQQDGRFVINNMLMTITVDNGTTVQFAAPFMDLGYGLALVPVVTANGDTGIQLDIGRWTPGYIGNGFAAILPISTSDQAFAARICRAFHADPDTAWTDAKDVVLTWLRTWCQANNVAV